MHQWRPVTPRVKDLAVRVRDRVLQVDSERPAVITEYYKEHYHMLPILLRAKAIKYYMERKTLRIDEGELIVGNNNRYAFGGQIMPEWSGAAGWIVPMVESGEYKMQDDGLYHSPEGSELDIVVSPEDLQVLKDLDPWWQEHRISTYADAWRPEGYDELCDLGLTMQFNKNAPLMTMNAGHMTPGYQKILTVGYKKIRDDAAKWVAEHRNDIMGHDMRKYLFYTAVVDTCDAVITMIHRYGDLAAEKAAAETDEKRKGELEIMAKNLHWIAENPVETYWQACQAAALYKLFLNSESAYSATSMGRFDQYTWPYLERELKAGTIDMDFAQELTDCFFLKLNCFYGGGPRRQMQTTGVGNTYQHTTIGGCDPMTGLDATNKVTFMTLETVARLQLHDPTVSLRVSSKTPDKLWEVALTATTVVGGLPLIQNDDVIIPGCMKELGFTLEDARNYAIIGCQEVTGSGNDYPQPCGINPPYSCHYGTIFACAINDGKNPVNGVQSSLHTGFLYDMKSIEEVEEAYEKMALYILKAYASINHYVEYLTEFVAPAVGMSISVEGCMEQGLDCTWGGAKYTSHGGTATGLATIADSLSTIEYMCFDKKLITTRQLYDAVMANWEGYEELRQQIIREVPHFGNNDPYADRFMKWAIDSYYWTCTQISGDHYKVFKAGLYGASDHIAQGVTTWATPDGRKYGDALADATSPAQGRDKNGPTAVLLSSCCYNQGKFMDGLALNIRIHPTAVARDDGIIKLRDMTKAYLENGGMETQYNIVSTETMRAAQDDPNAYKNLVVRIAGYSAYFVELSKNQQEDLISRTENLI
ncbi:MAG: hypothetical protein IKG08_00555 [Eubacterium sp.]|nr:hypothetical protein [Eubacterium sp.]